MHVYTYICMYNTKENTFYNNEKTKILWNSWIEKLKLITVIVAIMIIIKIQMIIIIIIVIIIIIIIRF